MSRPLLPQLIRGHCRLALLALSLLAVLPLRASTADLPASVTVSSDMVKQGAERQTALKTTVTLAAPAKSYFICEVRSSDKRKLDCNTILFRKGDTVGTGIALVNWFNVPLNTELKVTAFNVDHPDKVVSFAVKLRVKGD